MCGTGTPVPSAVQAVPLLEEKNRPSRSVAASMFVSIEASALTLRSVRPVLTAVQLVPLSEEINTPPAEVPANSVVPRTSSV